MYLSLFLYSRRKEKGAYRVRVVLVLEQLESVDIANVLHEVPVLFHQVHDQLTNVLAANKIHQLEERRVEQVVPVPVGEEFFQGGLQEVVARQVPENTAPFVGVGWVKRN